MTRVYLADAKPEKRSALRLLLLELKMEVVSEAATRKDGTKVKGTYVKNPNYKGR